MMQVNNENINETIVIDGDDNDAITVANTISTSPIFKKNPYALLAKALTPSRRNELEVMASNSCSHVKKKLKVSDRIQNDTIIILTDDDDDDGNNNHAQSQTFPHQSPGIVNCLEKSFENTQTRQTNKKKRERKNKLSATDSFMSFDNERVLDGNKKKSPKQKKTSKLNNKKNNKNIGTADDEIEVVWDSNPTDTHQEQTNNNDLFWYDSVGTLSNLEVLDSWDTPIPENHTQNNPTPSNVIYQNYVNEGDQFSVKKNCNNNVSKTLANTNDTNVFLTYINGYAVPDVPTVKKTRKNKGKALKNNKKIKRKRQTSETYVYDSSDEVDESKQNENKSLNTDNTTEKVVNNDKLRVIVVDGSNVAMAHSNGTSFSIKGIELIINYFTSRGHKVKVFLSKKRNKGKDKKLLEKWEKDRIVVFTPSRMVDNKRITPYDDRLIIIC